MLGAKDEASADAAGMIAKAKAAVKREKAGPGVSVLHQVELMHHSPLDFNEEPLQIPMVTNEPFSLVALRHIRLATYALLTYQVRWRRIVLDEAHSIKDRRCSTARAVFALTSAYKWALSGTPLQARFKPFLNLTGTWQLPSCWATWD